MANYFVRSTNGSSGDGSTWAAAFTTLKAATDVAAAGDTIYVADGHAGSVGTATTYTSAGTADNPVRILCVDDTGDPASPTTLATTATVTTTGASAMTFVGHAYVYGITFTAGSTTGAANINIGNATVTSGWRFEACALRLGGTNASSRIVTGLLGTSTKDVYVELINTTVQFGATGQGIAPSSGRFIWRDTPSAITGATFPTTLFNGPSGSAGAGAVIEVMGVDLSALGSGKNLVDLSINGWGSYRFVGCKLHASVSLTAATAVAGPGGVEATFDECDADATALVCRMGHYRYQGSILNEATIVRTGGATDGTTLLAWKMATLAAGPSFSSPLTSPWVAVWNEDTGSPIAITMDLVHDSVTNLTDKDIWIEVEYLGTAGSTLVSRLTDRAASTLATAADQDASAATWTTTGLTNPNEQKVSVSITPQVVGFIRARVKMAAVNKTVYVDPVIQGVTSSRQYMLPGSGAFLNATGGDAATYTAASNVRAGVDRGDGVIGTLDLPLASVVLSTATYDNGTSGTWVAPDPDAYLTTGDPYGPSATLNGNYIPTVVGDVAEDVTFGPGGTLVGTLAITGVSYSQAVEACQAALTAQGYTTARAPNLDNLDEAISLKLDAATYVIPPTVAEIAAGVEATYPANFADMAVEATTGAVTPITPAPSGYGTGTIDGTVDANIVSYDGVLITYYDGACQAATSSSITLANTAEAVDNRYNGREIELADGQVRTITDYVGSTRLATIYPDWDTTPGVGTNYFLGQLVPTFGPGTDSPGTTTLLTRVPDIMTIAGGRVAASLAAADVTGDLPADVQTWSVSAITTDITGNLSGSVGSVTAPVTATVSDKTGFSLAASGLDAIAVTDPGAPANHTTIPRMLVALWRRAFKKTTLAGGFMRTYADDNTTVNSSQAVSDTSLNESQGAAS